jgi:hypothetical protein
MSLLDAAWLCNVPTLPHSGSHVIHRLLASSLTVNFRRLLLEGQYGRLQCAQE